MRNLLRKIQFIINRRRKCVLGKGSILYPESKIINNAGAKYLISIEDNSHIRGELFNFGHGGRINIGSYCYVGEGTKIWSASSVKIGDRVLIGHHVNIFDNNTHPINFYERHQHFKDIITAGFPKKSNLQEEPITICDDVFIGCMSIILKGVTIGHGAIVGAGSVVTKDVPPWVIVAGNPAKLIRELTEKERAELHADFK